MNTPFVIVIFGATGDLAHAKLIPSLFSLYKQGILPEDFFIVGFARRPLTNEEFSSSFTNLTQEAEWADFAKHLSYQQGKFEEEEGYQKLIAHLSSLDEKMGACITRFFYLATPPQNYETILDKLHTTTLAEGCGQGSSKWTRVIIEKPFGKDLDNARALDEKLAKVFEEKQIFRVDHYLGKETVQNLLVFRFANNLFEPVWNKEYIDHVQITWAETEGVRNHGKFFDGVGILRDVAQNHLLQLLAAIAMEQPTSFSKEGVREARAKAIKAIRCLKPEEVKDAVVRGQYEGYTHEPDVTPDSKTETYVAMKLFVDTPRFEGVPFYLRAGKKLHNEEVISISVVFRQTCHLLFREIGCPEEGNILTFRIQPDEGIKLKVITKKPGPKLALETVDLHFSYKEAGRKSTDAYEKILLDIFAGDQMLFNRSDELASSWELITNILEGWKSDESGIKSYTSGTWGPKEGNELIEKDNKKWL